MVGHWPLAADLSDHAGHGLESSAVGIALGEAGPSGEPGTAARFDGCDSRLTIANHPALAFGHDELTLSLWIETDGKQLDVVGDLLSKFDTVRRKGLQLSVVTNSGVTSTALANSCNLHFGIDAGQIDAGWIDHGQLGNAAFVKSMTVHDGLLYAGTFEPAADQQGHLWRYDGGRRWTDLGNPVGCNAISSVTPFDGALYCGMGRYNPAGSAFGPIRNRTPGGQVYRVEPDGQWSYCGHPGAEGATPEDLPVEGYATGKADEVVALSVFRGELYCVSNHRCGVFKYAGETSWLPVGLESHRIMTLSVYRNRLYALINGGPIFRYEGGMEWTSCGHPDRSEQTYSGAIGHGELYVGTWPEGEVLRYGGGSNWHVVGRVGYEREVMGMVSYNGKLYLGTLPMANVWRMDNDRFTYTGTLDLTPAVLRRVWSMAVFQGRLFAGTMPSGHVHSIEAGKVVSWDHRLPGGWHHIAAVREADRLKLFVDGRLVAMSSQFHGTAYDLTNDIPLTIGAGAYEHFTGRMSDVRVYRHAATDAEVRQLSQLGEERSCSAALP